MLDGTNAINSFKFTYIFLNERLNRLPRSGSQLEYLLLSILQSCKRADEFRPEPSPNPKINLKPKSCRKKPES